MSWGTSGNARIYAGPSKGNGLDRPVVEIVHGEAFIGLAPRYTDLTYLGEGAYGLVVSGFDNVTQERVAIKKMAPFDHYLLSRRALREMRILTHIDHENVIAIRDIVIRAEKPAQLREIYIVEDRMDTDLSKVILNPKLTEEHVKYLLYQILRGLKYIHSANVLHRDLKPSNILVNTNCELRIADFGLARICDPDVDHTGALTEYVATRWYRAPEIMLSTRAYTTAVDIWAVGCMIGEMFKGEPLFPGKHYLDQMTLIFETLGSPTEDDMRCITNIPARRYVSYMPKSEKRAWNEVFSRRVDPLTYDLIEKMLTFNPKNRISVIEALAHPYFQLYSDPDDEPNCPNPLTSEMELDDLPTPRLKELIFQEVMEFKRKLPQSELVDVIRVVEQETKCEEKEETDAGNGGGKRAGGIKRKSSPTVDGKKQECDLVVSKTEE